MTMPWRVVWPAGSAHVGRGFTFTLTVAELFAGCGSASVDDAVPVLAYVPAVCGARTATSMVAWPALSSVPSGHVTTGPPAPAFALQELSAPATDAPTNVVPAGSCWRNVAPLAPCGPEFLTWNV